MYPPWGGKRQRHRETGDRCSSRTPAREVSASPGLLPFPAPLSRLESSLSLEISHTTLLPEHRVCTPFELTQCLPPPGVNLKNVLFIVFVIFLLATNEIQNGGVNYTLLIISVAKQIVPE